MRKTLVSTILFILFLLFIAISYLSFFGYETVRFNKIIKSELKKSNNNIDLNFDKISIRLDIKKLVLFVKLINPNLNYYDTTFPLKSLRANVNLEFLTKKKLFIEKINLSTEYLEFNKVKPILNKIDLKEENFKNIIKARFQINDLRLEFDENFKLKKNYTIDGNINTAEIKISNNYIIKNLIANFSYKNSSFDLDKISWNLKDSKNISGDFFDGKLNLKPVKKDYDIDLIFKTKNASIFPKISIMNYSFIKDDITEVKTKFSIKKNKTVFFKSLSIKNRNNDLQLNDLLLNKNYNLINFGKIKVKTSIDNDINNEFIIFNRDKITIEGKVFDAKMLIKELSKERKKNDFLKKISKEIKIDFNKILKGAKFPIKNFSLVGKINKGDFYDVLAKSDFSVNKHLDISLKKQKQSELKILEVYSDIALPLLSDYKFFEGLDGGNLIYLSKFDKRKSSNVLTINNFKLNKAPALAKLLTLADLKGLTDTLKGEGISFDTLEIKYESSPEKMDIKEIFMIGPSISILIDGYVEKKSGLISLRGTLVPAKTLNTVISKIPVIGEILVGKKVGEGVFGISFKIKGLPNNTKTTVNPVKTLTPRFITRALEAAKKKASKQE